MQIRQSKSLNKKIKKPRQLWLSSILTLFIFATTIGGYFLVQNSQDIRRSASEPYDTCIEEGGNWSSTTPCCSGLVKVTSPYGYFCGKAGTCTPGATKCEKEGTLYFEYLCDSSGYYQKNKRCDFGCSGNSCQADGCTPNSKRCTSDRSAIETCSSDGTGWTKQSCSSNTTCSSQTLTCVSNTPTPTPVPTPTAAPTPTPAVSCIKEGGNWSSTTPCCSGLVKVTSPYGYFCGKAGTCTPGATKCEKEGTLYFEYLCDSSGYYQKNKRCDFGCSGNSCQTSGCTPNSKRCTSDRSAIETCSSDGTAWTKRSCSTNTTCSSQTLTCVSNTPTPTAAPTASCEGTCYTNSSCSAIGKVEASGSCLKSTSICCKEAAAGIANVVDTELKAKGEPCSNSSECITGECARTYINNIGQPVFLAEYLCVPSMVEQDQSIVQQNENALLLGATGAVAATTVAAGGVAVGAAATTLPALTPLGLYSYVTATLATAPAWVQTGLTATGLAAGWSSVAGGTYACVNDPNSDACSAFVSGVMVNPAGLMQLASATDSFISNSYRTVNNFLTQQIDDMFDFEPSFGSLNGISVDDMNYMDVMDQNILGPQIQGNVSSPAINSAASQANQLIEQGLSPEEAVAQVTHGIFDDKYQEGYGLAGDAVRSFEDMVELECGVQCRHISQFSTALANEVGLSADFANFNLSHGQQTSGHAVTLIQNMDGSLGVIDATNNMFNQDVGAYINQIIDSGYIPTSNIEGAMQGLIYQIP